MHSPKYQGFFDTNGPAPFFIKEERDIVDGSNRIPRIKATLLSKFRIIEFGFYIIIGVCRSFTRSAKTCQVGSDLQRRAERGGIIVFLDNGHQWQGTRIDYRPCPSKEGYSKIHTANANQMTLPP